MVDMNDVKFNDRYFPRVDLSNKSRYKYYKYGKRDFAYDTKDCLVLYIVKEPDMPDENGNLVWREIDAIGMRPENWKNKEARDEYLQEYTFNLDDMASSFIENVKSNTHKRVAEEFYDDGIPSKYTVSYKYMTDTDEELTGEIEVPARSKDEAEAEFKKHFTDSYTILDIVRTDDLEVVNSDPVEPVDVDPVSEEDNDHFDDETDEDDKDVLNELGNNVKYIAAESRSGNNIMEFTTEEDAVKYAMDNGWKIVEKWTCFENKEPIIESIYNEDPEPVNESLKTEWEYYEDDILDVAYELMMDGYCEGMEAADIQYELLYADHATIGDAPYIFTMLEDDEDDEDDDDYEDEDDYDEYDECLVPNI